MKKTIIAAIAAVALIAVASPSQAGFLDTLHAQYNDGCSVHALSVTCLGHKQLSVANPFTSTSTGSAPNFNDKGVVGWWDNEGNIDLSHIIAPSGNLTYHDECKRSKAVGTLIPPNVTVTSTTTNGKC